MTQDEAEKLARELRPLDFEVDYGRHPPTSARKVRAICDHILSGDMRREIENAAYERAIDKVKNLSPRGAGKIQQAIRSLIQPPAQKEDGK